MMHALADLAVVIGPGRGVGQRGECGEEEGLFELFVAAPGWLFANTHEVAQRENPEATVVYIDNDPAVAAYGRAILEENDRTYFAVADLTDSAAVLGNEVVAKRLDWDETDRAVAVRHAAPRRR